MSTIVRSYISNGGCIDSPASSTHQVWTLQDVRQRYIAYRLLRYEIAQLPRDPEFNAEWRKDDEALRTMFKAIAIAKPTREMERLLRRTVFCYESVHDYQKQLQSCDTMTLIGKHGALLLSGQCLSGFENSCSYCPRSEIITSKTFKRLSYPKSAMKHSNTVKMRARL